MRAPRPPPTQTHVLGHLQAITQMGVQRAYERLAGVWPPPLSKPPDREDSLSPGVPFPHPHNPATVTQREQRPPLRAVQRPSRQPKQNGHFPVAAVQSSQCSLSRLRQLRRLAFVQVTPSRLSHLSHLSYLKFFTETTEMTAEKHP